MGATLHDNLVGDNPDFLYLGLGLRSQNLLSWRLLSGDDDPGPYGRLFGFFPDYLPDADSLTLDQVLCTGTVYSTQEKFLLSTHFSIIYAEKEEM
jgi:hypothetical protein